MTEPRAALRYGQCVGRPRATFPHGPAVRGGALQECCVLESLVAQVGPLADPDDQTTFSRKTGSERKMQNATITHAIPGGLHTSGIKSRHEHLGASVPVNRRRTVRYRFGSPASSTAQTSRPIKSAHKRSSV